MGDITALKIIDTQIHVLRKLPNPPETEAAFKSYQSKLEQAQEKTIKSVEDVSDYVVKVHNKLQELKKCIPDLIAQLQEATKAIFGRLVAVHPEGKRPVNVLADLERAQQMDKMAKALMQSRLNEVIAVTETAIAKVKEEGILTLNDIDDLKGCMDSWEKSKDESHADEKKRLEEEKTKREEEERLRKEEEETLKREELERKKREKEEQKRKEEEERMKIEKERLKREAEEKRQREEEERLRKEEERRQKEAEERERNRKKLEEEERRRRMDRSYWDSHVYKRENNDQVGGLKPFHGGVCCMVASPPGDIKRDELECFASDELNEVSERLDDDEKPASSMVSIKSKKGHISVPDEIDDMFYEHFGLLSTSDSLMELDEEVSSDDEEKRGDVRETIENNIQLLINSECNVVHESAEAACGPAGDAGDSIDPDDLQPSKCSNKTACLKKFSNIEENILNVREMTKAEKEMLIMGSLMPVEGGGKKGKLRQKYTYTYNGKKICKECFKYAFDVGNWTLKYIFRHVKLNGKVPRIHGNMGRKPSNAFDYDQVRACVDFLDRKGEEFGWPMPAPLRGRGGIPPVFMPASFTKKALHAEYREACQQASRRPVGLTSFKNIWAQCLPHIKIATPRDDVCQKCELMSKQVLGATTEESKLAASQALSDHIVHAQAERHHYRECVAAAQEETSAVREQGPIPPCSTEYRDIHYTFDFSQQVSIPHHCRQMGPLYFVTPRKVQLFGVRDDGGAHQYNYLINENETIGLDGSDSHGPNAVISMLDHALTFYGYGERRCLLHCDNCYGQNKNRFTLAYLCWRVMSGLHDEIELHMQVPGHTRCNVDAGFAHIKRMYRRTDVDSVYELVALIDRSAASNHAVTFIKPDGEERWSWCNWKAFLSEKFKAVPGISKFFHFYFSSSDKGHVTMKVKATDDVSTRKCLLRPNQESDVPARPGTLRAPGLSVERQRYLFKCVRPMVRQECQDSTCPQPIGHEKD